jgi:hypothetical protein
MSLSQQHLSHRFLASPLIMQYFLPGALLQIEQLFFASFLLVGACTKQDSKFVSKMTGAEKFESSPVANIISPFSLNFHNIESNLVFKNCKNRSTHGPYFE